MGKWNCKVKKHEGDQPYYSAWYQAGNSTVWEQFHNPADLTPARFESKAAAKAGLLWWYNKKKEKRGQVIERFWINKGLEE
jgi:hypothetical protein